MSISTAPVIASTPAPDVEPAARAERPARAARSRQRSIPGWCRLLSPIALLVLWQIASATGAVSPQKVPSPVDVWQTAIRLITTDSPAYGTLQGALVASLERMASGFALGAAVALVFAVVSGLSRVGETIVDPLMQMLRTIPLFGLVPVFIVWFGIGQEPKLLLIALGAGIPLYLNTFAGIRSVDPKFVEAGRVLGLNRLEVLRHVVLPGALPQILVGLRQSLGAAWLSLVVAEQLNTKAGLGFLINQATQFLQNDVIFVALIVYTILGLITDWLVRIAERRALAWRRELVN
ncbi:ABC transporter permease [Jongsikchunia kroppenstedtii]|uniref:ABC transporter permease n=1 Tax=Jongsikchunia kroppenstedtii TaxID=1121721 RepID=UPI00035E00EF|nr:ABC transporter permease [Jongsikchunia kroppenstedtii]